jgi:hypothetical protein
VWRKLSNEELHDLYSSPTILRVITGDKVAKNEMGGAYSSDGEGSGVYRVLVGKLKEGDHWGYPGVYGRIILRWIFKK